jgi:hypothetical protein
MKDHLKKWMGTIMAQIYDQGDGYSSQGQIKIYLMIGYPI